MRYYQSGGGYFPFEVTDKGERIRARKDYLGHCENVVKNGDIGSRVSRNALREELKLLKERGIEEKEYSYKKRLLSTIEKSIESRNYLITQLKLDVDRGIEKHYSGSPHVQRIQKDKDMIFDSCDEWISENMTVDNCLMTVNVVSLQIIILFTYASLGYKEPTLKDWLFADANDKVRFSTLTHSHQLDYNWRNFEHVYNNANTIRDSSRPTHRVLREFLTSGIITVLDNLSIDTIIEQYLNEWYTCQIVYKKIFAHFKSILPFEYFYHDLVHYSDFKSDLHNNSKYSSTLKTFYDFINKFACNQKQKYSVKVIFFIVIHEATGKWFEDELFKGNLAYETHQLYTTSNGYLWLDRFAREDDLLLLIPEKYRPPKEEEESPKYPDRIVAYLNTALANYLYVLEEFKKEAEEVDEEKLHKERLKRVKNMMEWKEHSPIPELLLYTKELESLGCERCTPSSCCLSGGTRNKKRKKRKNKTRKYPGTVSHRHSL